MGISSLLDEPIFEGSTSTSDVPYAGPVAIAGHVYQIDPKEYDRQTLDVLRGSSDIGSSPGEQSLNTHGLWRRTAKDWRLGAGQVYFDDASSSDERFASSKGIDALTTPRQVSLLNDTSRKLASTNTNLHLLNTGTYAYFADGSAVKYTTDFASFLVVATAGPVASIATDGIYVYVATGAHNLQRTALGTGVIGDFGTFQPSVVAYANGRLLAAAANRLVEIDNTGAFGAAGQLDYSHPNPSFVWKGILGTPSAIYAWGDANGISEVYFVTLDPSNGQLKQPTWAWSVPAGETVLMLRWYSTVMIIGTTVGVRLATQSQSGTLANGASIDVAGGVGACDIYRSSAWFSWSNFDTVSTGLGRLDLAVFVDAENLVPSYQSDLMATTQGTVQSVMVFGGKVYFAVSGSGLWGQSTDLVASGQMDSGWLTFSTIERKVVVSVAIRHEPLTGSVAVATATDTDPANGGTWVGLSVSDHQGTTGPGSPFAAANQGFERMKVQMTLNRSGTDATKGPTLRRWTARAVVTPYRTDQIVVPVRLFSRVQATIPFAEGGNVDQDILAEFLYLKSLEANGAIVRYQEGTESYDCFIDGIELKPARESADGSFFETLMYVKLLTVNTYP